MSKDPAFLFYPGDYLRDTQCLSESVQVAYDRIMCEHMRNICISQAQLNFFTKRLTEDQKSELLMVLTSTSEGFYIPWVHESIINRRAYSKSRSENRRKSHDNDMKTYVNHMENEIENVNGIVIKIDFEPVWARYPKKVGRKQAERHFHATVKTEKDIKDIGVALDHYLASERVFKGFVMNGPTFFNQWRDWVTYQEPVCERCRNTGKYISTTGYESICECPKGKNLKKVVI